MQADAPLSYSTSIELLSTIDLQPDTRAVAGVVELRIQYRHKHPPSCLWFKHLPSVACGLWVHSDRLPWDHRPRSKLSHSDASAFTANTCGNAPGVAAAFPAAFPGKPRRSEALTFVDEQPGLQDLPERLTKIYLNELERSLTRCPQCATKFQVVHKRL